MQFLQSGQDPHVQLHAGRIINSHTIIASIDLACSSKMVTPLGHPPLDRSPSLQREDSRPLPHPSRFVTSVYSLPARSTFHRKRPGPTGRSRPSIGTVHRLLPRALSSLCRGETNSTEIGGMGNKVGGWEGGAVV